MVKFTMIVLLSLFSINAFADVFNYKCSQALYGGRTAKTPSILATFGNNEVKLVKLSDIGEETNEVIFGRLKEGGRARYARFELTTEGFEDTELIAARSMLTGERSVSHISLVKSVNNRSELDVYVCSFVAL